MFYAIYYEEEICQHPFVQKMLNRYPSIPHVPCGRYTEIFNRKAQNFRLQKQAPALILAKKHQHFVLPTPADYGIGGESNYYFSHMLNCVFDCRYCFLQGMLRSGHYVLFVNFDNFMENIEKKIIENEGKKIFFFSGYDCDSLALETVTGFIAQFLPFFRQHPTAFLELRTKSVATRFLMETTPMENCIVAYTLTPHTIGKALEHKAPSVTKRIAALEALQKKGWPVGLRFDPLIFCNDYKEYYRDLFAEVFQRIDGKRVHSVTFGTMRFPQKIYKNMIKMYPEEKLLAHSLQEQGKTVSYHKELEQEMLVYCQSQLQQYVPDERLYPNHFKI